jgi:2-hydroxy-3-keto-5-methylthiopentenyl-1-phosphate phosphatase
VTHKGFELENRVASVGRRAARSAGLLDKLTQFRDWFMKSWKKMSSFFSTALRVVEKDASIADKAYKDLDKGLKSVGA